MDINCEWNNWAPIVLIMHRLPNLVDLTVHFNLRGSNAAPNCLYFDSDTLEQIGNLPENEPNLQRVTVVGAGPSVDPAASSQHISTFLRYCTKAHTLTFLRCILTPALLDSRSTLTNLQRLVLHGGIEPKYRKHPGVFTAAYARLWKALTSLREAIVWLGTCPKLPLPELPATAHTLCLQQCVASEPKCARC